MESKLAREVAVCFASNSSSFFLNAIWKWNTQLVIESNIWHVISLNLEINIHDHQMLNANSPSWLCRQRRWRCQWCRAAWGCSWVRPLRPLHGLPEAEMGISQRILDFDVSNGSVWLMVHHYVQNCSCQLQIWLGLEHRGYMGELSKSVTLLWCLALHN